jgi:membrane peptidoglycan carboxypeptidase
MVGYTGALAASVWLGTVDGKPLRTKDGSYQVFGATGAGPIWRQFMEQATAALKLDPDKYRFGTPTFPDDAPEPSTAPPSAAPTSATPSPTSASPTPSRPLPTCDPLPCASASPTEKPRPTPDRSPTLSPSPSLSPSRSTKPR